MTVPLESGALTEFSFLLLASFDSLHCDDTEETSLQMPWRLNAATKVGARELAERASPRPFGSCMFCTHQR